MEDDTHVLAGDTHPLKYFQSSSRLPLSGSQQILAGLLDLKFQFDFLPTLRVLSESTRPPELFCTNQSGCTCNFPIDKYENGCNYHRLTIVSAYLPRSLLW